VGKRIFITALVLGMVGVMAFVEMPVNEGVIGTNVTNKEGFDPVVVLELFTSQGCSSCPAADALLNKIKKTGDPRIFTLSYHVDYWNYIGWEDPFSKPQHAGKQKMYNLKFGNSGNYTPQMVINGREHFVGSNGARLVEKVKAYKEIPASNSIGIRDILKGSGHLSFRYEIEGETEGKNIRALLVLDERTTVVKKGENRNRTLVNSNIVVAENRVGIGQKIGSMQIMVPEYILPKDTIQLVVLVETDDFDITAAVKSGVGP